MATTTNYAFDLPVVGGNQDTWGGLLNGNWTALDTLLNSLQSQVNGKALTAGNISQAFSASRLLVADGSALSPSITFNSDGATDTGFYWGGDGNTNFTNNGAHSGQISVGGNLTMVGNITAYSDERLKSDIVTIPDALDKVCALRGVNYTKDGIASTGVIAQEVQKIIPEVVQQNEEYLSVAYGNLVGVLIEAIKELKSEIETLKKV